MGHAIFSLQIYRRGMASEEGKGRPAITKTHGRNSTAVCNNLEDQRSIPYGL
jgi:hypothetical protein